MEERYYILIDLAATISENSEEAARLLVEAFPLTSQETETVLKQGCSNLYRLRDALDGLDAVLYEHWVDGGERFYVEDFLDITSLPVYADDEHVAEPGVFSWDGDFSLVGDGLFPNRWRLVPRWGLGI